MNTPFQIVIVDDHPGSLELLSVALRREGVAIQSASDSRTGLELIKKIHPQLVITDLMMPGLNGLELLSEIMQFDPAIDVLLMTGHYTTETAVEAIRNGAADYLQKPVDITKLRKRVGELIESSRRRLSRTREGETEQDHPFSGMISRSPEMWRLFDKIERIAPHFRSVLVLGPTGSGKDLVARALHERSGATGRFVVLNCSAISEQLFESEMFGHLRGAFTGADREKVGLFQFADNGTLFLDEVGDMPLLSQAKLLRAIQNQEVLPLGALTSRKVNVRVVAATHKNIREEIARGAFREDLFYRLSMVELDVPPLSRRTGDVVLLARYFVQKFAREYRKRVEGLTPRALLVLERYNWPGNVRELEHVIGRACMLVENSQIDVLDLPEYILGARSSVSDGAVISGVSLDEQERNSVLAALCAKNWNQSEAARALGVGRDALRYKMKKHNLSRKLQGR